MDPATLQASDFTVNGTPANTGLTGGSTTLTFTFNSTPVITQGLQTMHIAAGAFNKLVGGDPVLEFTWTFRWDATLLQVTTTVPPVGGTFTGPASRTYDVNWNMPVDPTSVQTSDLTLSGVPATVTAVSVINGNMTTEFTINFTGIFSGTLTASIAAGAITDTFGNPSAAFSGNYNYVGSVCDSGLIQNGGFETGGFTPGWIIDGTMNAPVVNSTNPHSGTFSALAGNVSGTEPLGDSSFYQQFTVPAGGGTLSFWHWDYTTDSITFDWQDAYITNASGTILQTIFHQCLNGNTWINQQVDMTPYAGQTVRIKFLVHQDGFGDDTGMYVDDVGLFAACGAPVPSSAVSRKVHGAAGTFDVNLPLVPIGGAVGIEDRTGAVAGVHQEVITFATPVTLTGVAITSGTGSATFSGSGTAVITVNLTGVTNAQRLGVTLMNVNNGTATGDVFIPMGVLSGDTNANGSVSAADVSQTKAQSGNTTTAGNFRTDVNASGAISAADVSLVKSRSGTVLPPLKARGLNQWKKGRRDERRPFPLEGGARCDPASLFTFRRQLSQNKVSRF